MVMAEIWGAAIAVVGAAGSAAMQADAAKDASRASQRGADSATAEQRRQYDTTRADTAPYRAIGTQAINALGSIYGYAPAAQPMSFDAWSAANPSAFVLPKKPKKGFLEKHLGHALDPTAAFKDAGIIGKKGGGATGYDQARSRYQDYLSDFNAVPQFGSSPKSNPRTNGGAGNAFAPTPQGGIEGRVAAGGGVTIDNDTGQVINDTAIGPAMPAGPDYSNFFASPDYTFRRGEGTRGIERSAAASGLTGSGNALAALADYNSNLAAGEFGNYFNRQAALAGIGQTAVNTATTAGMNASNNIGATLQNAANARASGIGDSADAWGNALGTISGIAYDRWGRPKKGN
jgi:hypothetical protein